MKKLYAFVSLLGLTALLPATVSAQHFVYTPSQVLVDTVEAENFAGFQIDIATPTPEAITFGWERVSNTFHANWTYSLCDFGGCYVGIPASGQMGDISLAQAQNGTTGFFKVNLTVGQNFHQGVAKFYVYDMADHSRGDTVTFDILWEQVAVSVSEEQAVDFKFFPNPVTDQLTLKAGSTTTDVAIIDLTGKVLDNQRLGALSSQTLNMSEYQAGIYFLRARNAAGEERVHRLVKK